MEGEKQSGDHPLPSPLQHERRTNQTKARSILHAAPLTNHNRFPAILPTISLLFHVLTRLPFGPQADDKYTSLTALRSANVVLPWNKTLQTKWAFKWIPSSLIHFKRMLFLQQWYNLTIMRKFTIFHFFNKFQSIANLVVYCFYLCIVFPNVIIFHRSKTVLQNIKEK